MPCTHEHCTFIGKSSIPYKTVYRYVFPKLSAPVSWLVLLLQTILEVYIVVTLWMSTYVSLSQVAFAPLLGVCSEL